MKTMFKKIIINYLFSVVIFFDKNKHTDSEDEVSDKNEYMPYNNLFTRIDHSDNLFKEYIETIYKVKNELIANFDIIFKNK